MEGQHFALCFPLPHEISLFLPVFFVEFWVVFEAPVPSKMHASPPEGARSGGRGADPARRKGGGARFPQRARSCAKGALRREGWRCGAKGVVRRMAVRLI